MKIRDIAEFRADFPDDSVEDERGFVRYPGLGVAEAIAQMFRDMGFGVPGPEGEMELGWAFDVHVGKRRYWFRLSDLGDRIILISRDMTRYEPTPGDIGHEDLLRGLDAAMKADRRFSDIAWFTDAEYQRAGEGTAKGVRTTPPLGKRLWGRAKLVLIVCFVLFWMTVLIFEGFNALDSAFAGRRGAAGLHALVFVVWVVLLFWGPRWLTNWRYSRRS